jgi:glycosyltransferase involved in cell wall biosynthesis
MSARALASVLIPAYNERHFAAAFESARSQTYAPLEIVVCDDSPGSAIEETVKGAADARVRYERNPRRLGFGGNFSRCYELSRGEYVKFLNDDDLLRPACVEVLAGALAADPGTKLAASRRLMIDESGAVLADVAATSPLAAVSAIFSGRELGDYAISRMVNFIGEPTTALFRRGDLALEEGAVFRWKGREYHCLADLSLWVRLMGQGLVYYHAAPLSAMRRHAGQEQEKPEVRVMCLVERLWLVESSRALGFLGAPSLHQLALENLRGQVASFERGEALDAATRERVAELREGIEREATAAAKTR